MLHERQEEEEEETVCEEPAHDPGFGAEDAWPRAGFGGGPCGPPDAERVAVARGPGRGAEAAQGTCQGPARPPCTPAGLY